LEFGDKEKMPVRLMTKSGNGVVPAGNDIRFKNVIVTQDILGAADLNQRSAAKTVRQILAPTSRSSKLNRGAFAPRYD